MKYISTRGDTEKLGFKDVFLSGLAPDGGLFLPESYPCFSASKIASFQNMSYQEVCFEVVFPFVKEDISSEKLKEIIAKSYQSFSHKAITPLKQLDSNLWLLELFHGPTFAFKDVALQFMGHILEYFLSSSEQKAIILGATSGDTGSAAIMGCKASKNADIFIMHPLNKTSAVQRKQMTSIVEDNVFNIAIEGNFDDCQQIVKDIFLKQDFIKEGGKKLIAVNSINWARIIAQTVYYFYAATRVGGLTRKFNFSVPTGNFGDIFAGFVAKKMGLPINKLIIATNKNDILHRFVQNNSYKKQTLFETLSPSMDIQISSNFERMLFEMLDRDSVELKKLMEGFQQTGELFVQENVLDKIRESFTSNKTDDVRACEIMQEIARDTNEVIDPHSAAAIDAAFSVAPNYPTISLATAHPAKFPQAMATAKLQNYHQPKKLLEVLEKDEKFTILDNSTESIQAYISKHSLYQF